MAPWVRGLRRVAGVVAVAALFAWTGNGAKGPPRCDRVASMVALEMAGTAAAAANLRAEWQEMSGLRAEAFADALRRALRWDFGFLAAYTLALALGCRAVGRAAGGWQWRRTAAAARVAVLLAIAAALLDAIENVALWRGLSAPARDTWPSVARLCAIPKFAIVGLIVVFLLGASAFLATRRLREDPDTWPLPLLWATPLGTWILSYPVLLAVTTLVVGVAWRGVLAGLGIPDLFWHESMRYQFLAGLGTGLLVADLGLIGFLLDAPSAWMKRLGKDPGFPGIADPTVRALVRYLLLTSAPIAAGVIASFPRAQVAPAFLFPFGVIGGAVAFGYVVVLVWSRTRWPRRIMALLPRAVGARARATRIAGVGDDALDGLAALVMGLRVVLLALLVVGAAVGGEAWTVAPGFAICLLLGTVVSVYGLFVFYFPLHRFGLVAAAALILAVVTGVGGANHRIREMSYQLSKPSAGDATPIPPAASGLADDARVLENWLATYGPRGPLVVVAVDGGGARAATWTMAVLTQLEQDFGAGFASQVRVLTGASGGMQAAAYWAGSLEMTPLARAPMHLDARGNLITAEALRQDVARDSLTPLTKRLVLHDVFPGLAELAPDRGDAIQQAWVENTRGVFGRTVRSLQAGEVAGWRPSLVISPMIVEDGRRLLISNLDLDAIATEATPQRPLGRSAIEFARFFPDAALLRLGTAVRMSATFPYVMPVMELPTAPPLRVVDAGYYDEHGVALAAAWLLRHSVFLRGHARRVILVEVPDALASLKKSAPCNDRPSLLATGFSGFTTPVEGILSGRDALSAYGNDELIETVAGALNTEDAPDRFVSVAFEPPYDRTECGRCARAEDEVPLSWSINTRDRERLQAGMNRGRNLQERARLREWWKPARADTPRAR